MAVRSRRITRAFGVPGKSNGRIGAVVGLRNRWRPLGAAKTRMAFSVGGQGWEVLRSRMQSASAMHWSTISWQVSALSVRLMITRSAS
jgi:hypothetical protein